MAERPYNVLCQKSFGRELGEARLRHRMSGKKAGIDCSFKMTGIQCEREMKQDFQGEEGVVLERSETQNLAAASVVPEAASPMSLLDPQNLRPLSRRKGIRICTSARPSAAVFTYQSLSSWYKGGLGFLFKQKGRPLERGSINVLLEEVR